MGHLRTSLLPFWGGFCAGIVHTITLAFVIFLIFLFGNNKYTFV